MKPYERFPTPCDLSTVTLQDAILKVGPSDRYVLRINRSHLGYAHDLIAQEFTCKLPVVINIETTDLDNFEWYVSANGRACGSEGAG